MKTTFGSPTPRGPSLSGHGYNFSLFSQNATKVHIAFYKPGAETCFCHFPLYQTGNVWHIAIEDLELPIEYAYFLDGPLFGKHLFDATKPLLDPYAPACNTPHRWGDTPPPLRALLETAPFDWEGDLPLNTPLEQTIIYEMHVRAFTQDASSKVTHPGTFLGLLEKIPYLQKLGVTAVELMPIYEFNERSHRYFDTTDPLYNFWGYSTVSFFAPMNRYAVTCSVVELKTLIKAFHKAGIEVLLDVVYNHTNEGNSKGYYESLRGIDNSTYYMLTEEGEYFNYSGCGNTVNCNHPEVVRLIVDSLVYWVTEYHIDGFRFDLASILTRGENGVPLESPPLIEAICNHPALKRSKLLAEAWDCGGLYQLGSFPRGDRFSEWNGIFRDTVRRYVRGESKYYAQFVEAFLGSPSMYQRRGPLASINFITAHDGFTLYDLTTYDKKHNELNREENKDGHAENESWNCGIEGETTDTSINRLRKNQLCTFFSILLLARGVPMMLMGDEYAHTRFGNNNAWCHDNFLNYFLWEKASQHGELFSYVQTLIQLRKNHITLKTHYEIIDVGTPALFCCAIDDSLLFTMNVSNQRAPFTLPEPYSCILGGENYEKGLAPHASLVAEKR